MAVMIQEQITLSSVVDIKTICRYYLLQEETQTAPTKPTTNPPGSSWVTVEPSYTAGSMKILYFVDCTVYSDDTFTYSEVSVSSSYAAAKAAYEKAVVAQNKADKVEEDFENLEIGARNLIRNSETMIYVDYCFKASESVAILGVGVLGKMILGTE